jgi:molybdopterin-guanine dinucleotide biosynthesis protein A
MVISANRNNAAYAALGYPVVSDLIAGYAGPLAGLHAGLTACTTPLLCTAPCDAPLLPTDLVLRLADAMARDSAPVAVVRTDGHLQPTFILCRRAVLPNLEQYLAGGGRKFGAWLAIVGALPVDFADAHAFANINTREDLARLETQ